MSKPYLKPLPSISPLTQPFWDHARKGRLVVQACKACGDLHFPPSPVCPVCLSTDQDWKVTTGRGTLMSWVVYHRAYWDSFKEDLPYTVCLVQLDEGPMFASNFASGMTGDPKIGAAMQVVFEPATDTVTLPKFKLI